MEVKINRMNKQAVIPTYGKEGDAGMDLTAISKMICDKYIVYNTGIRMEIPEGYVGLLFPRSSCSNMDLILSNCVGVIDSGYRGEISFRFKLHHSKGDVYDVGDRVGQIIIMPYPKISFVEVDKLGKTDRGDSGYGSTGK